MNKEDLFEGFGALDDDLLKRSEQTGKRAKKREGLNRVLKYGSIAACLAAMLGAGMLFMDHRSSNPPFIVPESGNAVESNGNSPVQRDHSQDEPESYIDISMLLASNEGVIKQQTLENALVEIENHSAHYYKVASVESDLLRESIGGKVPGTQKWHKVSGHEDVQYLISGDDEGYSLWKFESFGEEKYPYSDVLQIIYNIRSAEDIDKVMITPANMDNTDEGQAIQDQIGTSIVMDDKAIETIYNVLSGLTCYGKNHWDMIGLEGDTPAAMQNQVRAGRYLTLVTSQGMEIDTLKYTAISGMFYEYGGIAYSALTMEEKTAVEKILNIEWTDTSTSEANIPAAEAGALAGEANIPADEADAPADEEPYREARAYSAELTDLQNRISEAMVNKELPFVTESAIYENPDRVHVTVNTTDEELLTKLRAFDTTGKLLEIEYSERETQQLFE